MPGFMHFLPDDEFDPRDLDNEPVKVLPDDGMKRASTEEDDGDTASVIIPLGLPINLDDERLTLNGSNLANSNHDSSSSLSTLGPPPTHHLDGRRISNESNFSGSDSDGYVPQCDGSLFRSNSTSFGPTISELQGPLATSDVQQERLEESVSRNKHAGSPTANGQGDSILKIDSGFDASGSEYPPCHSANDPLVTSRFFTGAKSPQPDSGFNENSASQELKMATTHDSITVI